MVEAIDIKGDEQDLGPRTWRSLCLVIDPGAALFFAQLVFMAAVLVFCMIQLLTIKECEGQQFYSGTIIFILGLLLPGPRLRQG